ncbi:MAG: histidinol-phosphate transaminase [Flavobacteriaceae bacterium]|nr:histidinol-phosphate transaminase [Flavobacteriaceae bacterium]
MKATSTIQNLIRENIKNIQPYASARDEFTEVNSELVFLDANENPFENGMNRYPDPQQQKVKQLLSEIKSVSIENILLGNGSDEVLDLIFRAFCEPNKDNIILLPPTYGMYKVLADINAIDVIEVQLTADFQPKTQTILLAANQKSKLLFLCSPNNPTGNSFSRVQVEKILRQFNGIVVLDEAYIDFSEQESWLNRLEEFPNLIISQTMSKAYGMAGIRLGVCYASKEIINVLNSIKPPYNVNALTQQKALDRLNRMDKIQKEIQLIKLQKEVLLKELKQIDFVEEVVPSDANFLLIKVDNPTKRYQQLIEKGIVVRNRSNQPLCENCLRISIGTEKENEQLIKVLRKLSK